MQATDISAKSRKDAANAIAATTAERAEAAKQESAAPEKKSGPLTWFVLAAILLVGAGGAGFWWMNRKPPVVAAAVSKSHLEKPAQFLKMEAMTVSIRRKDGSIGPFTVVIGLDLVGEDGAATLARPQIPRLRDAFLQALTVPALRVRPEDGRVSLEEVKARLLTASRAVLGADAVRSVLIEAVNG